MHSTPIFESVTPLTAFVGLSAVYVAYRFGSAWHALSGIPTVGGPSMPLLSYIGSARFLLRGKAITRKGYEKYKGGMYKIAAPDGWMVILCGRALAEELRSLPDSVMSFSALANQFLQTEFMVSRRAAEDTYHTDLVRTVLPKKLDSIFPEVQDEIAIAFAELLSSAKDVWTAVPAHSLAQNVICRASNRMLVGLPLCRDPEWVSTNIQFATDWVLGAAMIRVFPNFLKRTVGKVLNPLPRRIKRAMEMMTPTIVDHQRKIDELDRDHPDRPNDFLAWLIENANGDRSRTEPKILTEWIKTLNLASIDSSSIVFTHALYDLAVHPECITPLRDEIEAVIKQSGWTKAAMSELRKLDSFMRESVRLNGNSLAMARVAMKEHTFSNGVTIPAGITVEVATGIHHDEDSYQCAEEFLPFRFVVEDEKEGEGTQRHFTSISSDYLPFGYGKHACPGRFFASNEIKAMLAHIVLNYDVKAEVEGVRPPNLGFGAQELPNRDAKVLFRKRRE